MGLLFIDMRMLNIHKEVELKEGNSKKQQPTISGHWNEETQASVF